MKKFCIFLSIAAVVLLVFACTTPKEIEIRGTPALTFAANMELGEMFSEMFSDAMKEGFTSDDITVLDCTDPSLTIKTFLVYMKIPDQELNIELPSGGGDLIQGDKITIGGIEYGVASVVEENEIITLDRDVTLNEDEISFPIDFSDFSEMMPGFKFTNETKAAIFIKSEREVLNSLRIILKFDDKEMIIEGNTIDVNNPDPRLSGIILGSGEYLGAAMPGWGKDISDEIISLLNKKNQSDIDIDFLIPSGNDVKASWADDTIDIEAEIVIWLPLVLEADAGGGDLEFPADFMGDENADLFGRSDAESGIFEKLNIKIDMDKSPFAGGKLILESGVAPNIIIIDTPLSGTSLDFKINEEQMSKINNSAYFPFAPTFKIHFDKGEQLRLLKNFKATKVYFDATISYVIEIGQ